MRILITVFALPSVVLTLVLGVLSDRHERRKIRVPALLLFGVTGSLCAFARGFELLLALRLLQGDGGEGQALPLRLRILARGFIIILMMLAPEPRHPHGLCQCEPHTDRKAVRRLLPYPPQY